MFRSLRYALIGLLLFAACTVVHYKPAVNRTQQLPVNADTLPHFDSATHALILPYKLQLDSQVNTIIGSTTTSLQREKPEGTLGNLAADAVYASAHQFNSEVQFAVLNAGGLRLPALAQGDITVGRVFELMPFENEIVVLRVKGSVVQQLLDLVAANGGWPISHAAFTIQHNKATAIRIQTAPLDTTAYYVIATNDYVANGGDNAGFLKTIPSTPLKVKVRDAIQTYITLNSPLRLQKEGRITVHE